MTRTLGKWAGRLVVLTMVAVAIARILESTAPSDRTGGEQLPAVGGDTWPPVPLNPDRNR
jgi:hypothetical protein